MQWHFNREVLMVRCRYCTDMFEECETGMVVAVCEGHEGREAVMPDERPVRSIEEIVQNA